jgi:hypothetical protein
MSLIVSNVMDDKIVFNIIILLHISIYFIASCIGLLYYIYKILKYSYIYLFIYEHFMEHAL